MREIYKCVIAGFFKQMFWFPIKSFVTIKTKVNTLIEMTLDFHPYVMMSVVEKEIIQVWHYIRTFETDRFLPQ